MLWELVFNISPNPSPSLWNPAQSQIPMSPYKPESNHNSRYITTYGTMSLFVLIIAIPWYVILVRSSAHNIFPVHYVEYVFEILSRFLACLEVHISRPNHSNRNDRLEPHCENVRGRHVQFNSIVFQPSCLVFSSLYIGSESLWHKSPHGYFSESASVRR